MNALYTTGEIAVNVTTKSIAICSGEHYHVTFVAKGDFVGFRFVDLIMNRIRVNSSAPPTMSASAVALTPVYIPLAIRAKGHFGCVSTLRWQIIQLTCEAAWEAAASGGPLKRLPLVAVFVLFVQEQQVIIACITEN